MTDEQAQNQNNFVQQALLDKQFKNLRLASMFVFPIIAFIAFRAQDIFFFLPKEKLAFLSLQIVIWSLIFIFNDIFLVVIAWVSNKKQIVVSTVAIALLSFMPLNLYFAARYGLVGLAVTILLVSAIMFAFMLFAFAKIGVKIPIYKSGEKAVVASMAMMLTLHYTDSTGFAASFFAAAGSYALTLFIIAFLDK